MLRPPRQMGTSLLSAFATLPPSKHHPEMQNTLQNTAAYILQLLLLHEQILLHKDLCNTASHSARFIQGNKITSFKAQFI